MHVESMMLQLTVDGQLSAKIKSATLKRGFLVLSSIVLRSVPTTVKGVDCFISGSQR